MTIVITHMCLQARVRKRPEKFVELVGLGAVRATLTPADFTFFTRLHSDYSNSTTTEIPSAGVYTCCKHVLQARMCMSGQLI